MHRSRDRLQGARALITIMALTVLAGCRDVNAPRRPDLSRPILAQGDGGVWTVNTLDDSPIGDNNCTDAYCTLRQAIAAASNGDQIVFAPSLNGTISLDFSLLINKDISVDGAGRIKLDGQKSHLVLFTYQHTTVRMHGLAFIHGFNNGTGGAILNNGNLTISNSRINDSEGTEGGGIYNSPTGTLTLLNSTVAANTALLGAGVYNAADQTGRGTVSIIGSTIFGNVATHSVGGVYNFGGTLTIQASTISTNRSSNNASALQADGPVVIRSSTITLNEGPDVAVRANLSTTLAVANSIIAGNIATLGNTTDCNVGVSSLGNNLITDTGGCDFTEPSDIVITEAQLFTNVLQMWIGANGGPTLTHALIERGLAVDAGRCIGDNTDQRGMPRPVDEPLLPNASDGCDIGAYEWQVPVAPPPPPAPVADLMVSLGVDKGSARQGDLVTYTIRAQNLGPETAPGVVVNNTLSSGVTFVSVRANRGAFTGPPVGETGTVTWQIGDMLHQQNDVAELVVTVLVRGATTITNTADISGAVVDPNAANNSASIDVTVGGGGGNGGKKKK